MDGIDVIKSEGMRSMEASQHSTQISSKSKKQGGSSGDSEI